MSANRQARAEIAIPGAIECAEALEQGLDRLCTYPELAATKPLHDRTAIRALLHSALENATTYAERTPSWLRTPWNWEALREDDTLRVGLLTIYPRNPLPIHDHPGRAGLLLCLSGALIQHRYERTGNAGLNGDRAVTLRLLEERTINAGESCEFGPGPKQIHSLMADHRPAIVFEVLLIPEHAAKRHWFLPLRPYRSDETEIHVLPFQREMPGLA